MKQKLFSMLALLLMAATGAWADSFSADAYAANATLNGISVTANQTVTINEGVTVTVNNGLSIQSNATLTVTGGGTLVVNGANGANGQNEYFGTDPENGDEVMLKATPGGDGNSGIVIDNGGNLIIINATIIAVGGKGGQGGKNDDNSYAANGADGNGFASFPAIEGAVMSYSTNGTDYTEYASGDKTLYRYMKAVKVGPTTYSVTLAEGTEDADKWTIEPKTGLNGGETVTATYSGEKKVKSVKAVKKVVDPLAVPMTIEAITAGTIQVAQPKEGMQYSLNGGAKTAVTTDGIVLNVGDKVQFYGNGTTITSYGGSSSSDCTTITGNGTGFTCKVYGNIMSLVDEENFATAKTLSANYTFKYLFYDNTTLTDASGLLLPAPELKANCYDHMFSNCTALIAAPELPATQLATNCYYSMFANCSALTAAPEELPAETLAAYCYMQMFANCTALTTAPVLTAETLVFRCYYQMFSNCQKLATVTCLATSGIDQEHSTDKWLQNAGTQAQGAKTFNAVSTAEWPSNNNGIPSGWTRVNVDN